jgi:hypothetical protein
MTRGFRYEDPQWRKIKERLAVLGVKADHFLVGAHWYHTSARQRPLREGLEELSGAYSGLRKPPTPKQTAEKMRKALAKFEAARDVLDYNKSRLHLNFDEADDARQALTALIAKVRPRFDKLAAAPGSRSGNARKPHTEYWSELAQLCEAIAARPPKPQELASFLIACSPFRTSDSAAMSFAYRFKQASKTKLVC